MYTYLTKLRGSRSRSLFAVLGRSLPAQWINFLVSDRAFWAVGFLSGGAVVVEDKRKREMFNLYLLPRALCGAWIVARRNGLVPRTGGYGDVLVSAVQGTWNEESLHWHV